MNKIDSQNDIKNAGWIAHSFGYISIIYTIVTYVWLATSSSSLLAFDDILIQSVLSFIFAYFFITTGNKIMKKPGPESKKQIQFLLILSFLVFLRAFYKMIYIDFFAVIVFFIQFKALGWVEKK